MELLEVLRRWMWIFFRVETEWGKPLHLLTISQHTKKTSVRTNCGPASDDILLGEYNGDHNKIDYD